jgi:glycosyltransferase involved in cell wall biosynthesis
MRVTAVLAIRDEETYLANCLRELVRAGVDIAVIDNGSTDASASIYRRPEFAGNVVAVETFPYTGRFSLDAQLRCKSALIDRLTTDWVIHIDADEVMHSYRAGETLHDALSRVAAAGYNVVDFDEFVFLPIETEYVPEASGDQALQYYYFFQPSAPRLMRAWRKAGGFSMLEHAGHRLTGDDIRLAPETFALRHYMFRNQEHAFEKYRARAFAEDELAKGWHRARAGKPREVFAFPPAKVLKRMADPSRRDLDRSEPWTKHYWQSQRGRADETQ